MDGQTVTEFKVEIADTADERAVGLMNRASLDNSEGMLFVYAEPAPVSFWMRNTLIPLDLLFMDEAGVIRHIYEGAMPMDETPIPGAAPGDSDIDRSYVLEINAGLVDKYELKVGQTMSSDIIDPRNAALPCR